MGHALLIVVIFLTGQSENFAARFKTQEECHVALAEVSEKVATHNSKAPPPAYIVMYSAACVPIQEARRGRDA